MKYRKALGMWQKGFSRLGGRWEQIPSVSPRFYTFIRYRAGESVSLFCMLSSLTLSTLRPYGSCPLLPPTALKITLEFQWSGALIVLNKNPKSFSQHPPTVHVSACRRLRIWLYFLSFPSVESREPSYQHLQPCIITVKPTVPCERDEPSVGNF